MKMLLGTTSKWKQDFPISKNNKISIKKPLNMGGFLFATFSKNYIN